MQSFIKKKNYVMKACKNGTNKYLSTKNDAIRIIIISYDSDSNISLMFLLIYLGIGCNSNQFHDVTLASNEVFTEADIYVDSDFGFQVVVGLTFRTSQRNEYGPYGWTTGDMYTSRGSRLNGMTVYAGTLVDSITFVWECNQGMCYIRLLTDCVVSQYVLFNCLIRSLPICWICY